MQVLIPLPARDFDPSESAVPWRVLTERGHDVIFATEDGAAGQADPRMLTGRGFGPLRPMLRARADAREAYRAMSASDAFRHPKRLSEIDGADSILLPGGHAPGMRPYLESEALQKLVAEHMRADKPLGAICHGVLVVARSGALRGRTTTALLASQELLAWNATRLWLGDYYRTYPETVQSEVTRALGPKGQFVEGPRPLRRDAPGALARGFALRDGAYVSARWPGDVYSFAERLAEVLTAARRSEAATGQARA